mgnify:FL=1
MSAAGPPDGTDDRLGSLNVSEREHVRTEHNELWQSATPALAPGVVGVDAGMTLTKVARASEGGRNTIFS